MENGATTPFQAVDEGHADVFTVLLENNVNVNQIWENNATPLFQASMNGIVYVCKLLLGNNRNVNKPRRVQRDSNPQPLNS